MSTNLICVECMDKPSRTNIRINSLKLCCTHDCTKCSEWWELINSNWNVLFCFRLCALNNGSSTDPPQHQLSGLEHPHAGGEAGCQLCGPRWGKTTMYDSISLPTTLFYFVWSVCICVHAGSAADLCKMAMIKIFNLVSSSSLSARYNQETLGFCYLRLHMEED